LMKQVCIILIYLVCVFHLKKRLTVLDGQLRHHCARPEHIAVHCDVMVEDLGENPPGLQPPIQRLLTCPYPPLHRPIFRRINVVSGAFDFVGVAMVALVGLDPLARLEEVTKNLVINFNVSILTCRVWTLDPNQVPRKDVDAQLVAKGGFPRVFVGRKGVPLLCDSLLRDLEVGSVDGHRAVVSHIVGTEPSLEDDLRTKEEAAAGV
jgi:hypothetical protein